MRTCKKDFINWGIIIDMKDIIFAWIFFLLSTGAFIISICSFKEKGFLFNNAYIYASKQERDSMDKKPYYRQSAVAFMLIGIVFVLIGIGMLLSVSWILFVAMAIAVITVIYAITSDIAIERQKEIIE